MQELHSTENKKRYTKYTREMRIRLIQLVEEQKMSTAQAGRLVGIKQTSACRMIHSFRKHHRIFEKKSDRLEREGKEQRRKEEKNMLNANQLSSNSESHSNYVPTDHILERNQKTELKERPSTPSVPSPQQGNFQQNIRNQCPIPQLQEDFNPWFNLPRPPMPYFWPFPVLF